MFILSKPAVWVTLCPEHVGSRCFEWCYRFPCFPQNLLLLGLGDIVTVPGTQRKMRACVCLTVSLPTRMCLCFPKLIGITHHYTKKKKKTMKKNPHQCLLCFLNFINLVCPVLKHCWRCSVYKDWKKNKNAERVLAFENSSLEGAHLCCFLRDYFWKSFVAFLFCVLSALVAISNLLFYF